ncbi:MAG TPA: alpha/beta hydrolase [Anaerolineales bacterium]|nr:alpha/beta hydrolase [Anaerolineales bacterium]
MIKTRKEYFSMEDGQIYYETTGDGFPLVLSHAGFLDSRMFDAVWKPLAQHFRVIRYDMRGFGKSSQVKGPLSRRADLKQLLQHLGITRAHLVGSSMGGEISLDLALEQPQSVASLTLVDSVPSGFALQGTPPRYMFEMFDVVQRGEVERASELQIRIWLDGEYREPEQVDPVLRKKALAMNRIPVAQRTFFVADTQPIDPLDPPAVARLEGVNCPTLIVAGSLDHPEILRAADVMVTRIPNARKTILEGTAHVPSYEQPEKFVQSLLEFLCP